MTPILWSLAALTARAESVLEFKTSGPAVVLVDGRQAVLTGNMRQRIGGLEPGVHQLQVNGVFGKTLYEAEIDLPDNTITTAEWARGEVTVLSTDWLEDEVDDEADEDVVVEAPPVEAPAAVPVVDVAPPPPPVAEEVVEPAPPVARAPLAIPSAPAAPTRAPLPPAKEATAMASVARPRMLTVQATDGMRIDVVYEGRTLSVVVDGDQFRIEDASGAVLALGAE